MIEQVVIAKRIFTIAECYSRQSDPLSAGLAISLFQDAVEQLTWCIAKRVDLDVKDSEGFVSLLGKIEKKSGEAIPRKAKVLELNKARVSFKHYGNLPASSEAEKFRAYAYDFLAVSSQRYLDIDFDAVSLASLIGDGTIRGHIEAAQQALANDDIKNAVSAAARARFFTFKRLEAYLPKVDRKLRNADHIFEHIPEVRGRGFQVFQYLTQYLGDMARFNAAALAGGNIVEHLYFERALPNVIQFRDGSTKVTGSDMINPTKELAERAIKYVIDTAVRIESTVR